MTETVRLSAALFVRILTLAVGLLAAYAVVVAVWGWV